MSLRQGGNFLRHTAFTSGEARKHGSFGVILFASLMVVLGQSSSLFAAAINYGDFMGNTVTYKMVTEAANSAGDTAPLFGAPSVSGDSLNFSPVGFNASAAFPAGGADITDGNLNFMIQAKPIFAIPSVTITEFGDTTMAGFGTNATLTAVRMNGIFTINEIDGNNNNNAITFPISITNFSPFGGTFGLLTAGGGGPLFNSAWSGFTTINVNQELINRGILFTRGATKVTVNFDNKLIAINQVGTSAIIAKKGTNSVTITTGNTPEPTSALLALMGLTLAGCLRRSAR